MSDGGKQCLAGLFALGVLLHGGLAMSQPKSVSSTKSAEAGGSAAEDALKEDRDAARKDLAAFVKAFEARDAKALASHWTEGGEYRNDAGVTLRGREAIQKAFATLFATTPEIKAEIRPEALRFLSKDVAAGEGSVTVRRGVAETPTGARYKSLLVREDGRWRLAQLTETADDKVSISDLGWLVGEWKSTPREGAEIHTIYTWAPNKKFLKVQFSLKEKEIEFSGTQVLGVDPATAAIHSWTFEADGGVGEGDWSRDGDHWTIEAEGTLADGTTLTETNILRRIDADTFTWQSVDRRLGETDLADLPPVRVTRVKSKN